MVDTTEFNDGEIINISGNNPLVLNRPDEFWLIRKGNVRIFSVRREDGVLSGNRNYITTFTAGEALFGFDITELSQGLIAVGDPDTVVEHFSREKMQELLGDNKTGNKLQANLDSYCDRLLEVLTAEEESDSFKDEQAATEVAGEGYEDNEFFNSLFRAQRIIFELLEQRLSTQKKKEKEKLRIKSEKNDNFMKAALQAIAGVSRLKRDKGVASPRYSDNLLLQACKLIGQEMDIKIKTPVSSKQQKNNNYTLKNIARASHFNFRKVLLENEWWNRDAGPLLGYMEEDERPIALIPDNPGSYQLHDLKNNQVVKVTEDIAGKLKAFAYSFYRPFPDRVLNLKDIIQFGLKSTWKRDIVLIIIFGIATGLLGLLTPHITGIIVDRFIPQAARSQVLFMGLLLFSASFATFTFQIGQSLVTLRFESGMDYSIQSAVWDRMLKLPAPFFRQYTAGDLANRAGSINAIRMIISRVTTSSLFSSVFSVFNLFLLFRYNVKLALVGILLVAISLVFTTAAAYLSIKYQRQIENIEGKINGLILQLIGAISKLKIANAEKRAFYLWSKEFSQKKLLRFKAENIDNYLTVFNSVFPIITSMVIYWSLLKFKTESGALMPTGIFLAFNAAFSSFLSAMLDLSNAFMDLLNIVPLYERARPILKRLPEIDEQKIDPGEIQGEVEISHVNFKYEEEGPRVLKDVSLRIEPGEFVAIVGPSGSGKSTLFRLLLGFEKPESGVIYYDGQDLADLDLKALRHQLGVVLQNGKLMSGDIFTNIIGTANLTIDDAWEAARMAGLDKDIEEMPMGMHTVISEGGSTISGGQRQRLLIARAIVTKPRILLFDEATSALDNKTQALVSQSVESLEATRIVIAHRLSTIKNADRIYVLDRGEIVEAGDYSTLMETDGLFTRLAKRQLA